MSRNEVYYDEARTMGVTPRERRVSRNFEEKPDIQFVLRVTPRERRVSRNHLFPENSHCFPVTPRERRVSRNSTSILQQIGKKGHASREACE